MKVFLVGLSWTGRGDFAQLNHDKEFAQRALAKSKGNDVAIEPCDLILKIQSLEKETKKLEQEM